MLSHAALRQWALTVPRVTIDSKQLIELLDAAERAPKPRKPRAAPQVDPEAEKDEKCARWLYGVLLNTMPKAKEPNFKAWANDVRLMRTRDERTHREICELFQWAHNHAFWKSNILSPAKLRDQWERLAIQRDQDAQPKKQNTAWWQSDATRLAKANEVGVGPAHYGESTASWDARIRAAIDNGGKPPAPQVFVRDTPPAADPEAAQEQVRKAPGFLKEMLRKAKEGSAA